MGEGSAPGFSQLAGAGCCVLCVDGPTKGRLWGGVPGSSSSSPAPWPARSTEGVEDSDPCSANSASRAPFGCVLLPPAKNNENELVIFLNGQNLWLSQRLLEVVLIVTK